MVLEGLPPLHFRVGYAGWGIGVGVGVGVGFGSPLNLAALPPFIPQTIGKAVGLTTFLRTAQSQTDQLTPPAPVQRLLSPLARLAPPGLRAGVGCGVGAGYGWGAGLFLSPGAVALLRARAMALLAPLLRTPAASLLQSHAPRSLGAAAAPAWSHAAGLDARLPPAAAARVAEADAAAQDASEELATLREAVRAQAREAALAERLAALESEHALLRRAVCSMQPLPAGLEGVCGTGRGGRAAAP